MTDPKTIAEDYVAVWNETDANARSRRIAALFSESVVYRDPLMQGDGHAGLDALVTGVQQRFPGFRFTVKGQPDGHATHVRFSWSLGPDGAEAPIEGTDVCHVRDGRLAEVIGFLDKVPAQ
ncbi:nuclear transport factor 2 family protein [Aquibium sp. LZ166]|uniref:Nuclear transport factor 2 family protein n=1 Tax=Aquibium pacificus TaxID=3153579 RepID=A0ABV3SRR8_9HYPH